MTDERPRRMAFLILCHTDAPLVRRLVEALDWRADFFIHVDAKSDIRPFTSQHWPPSVHFLTDRVAVRWGGLSVVDATLQLLRACVANDEDYLRVVLLSGACFPIKPVQQLYDYFVRHEHHEFIVGAELASAPRMIRERVTRYWYFDTFDIVARSYRPGNIAKIALRRMLHLIARPFRKSMSALPAGEARLVFGSQWWAVTTQCARFLSTDTDQFRRLKRFLATSLAPDEIFFHTLAARDFGQRVNSPSYSGDRVSELANLHLIDPSLTKIFTAEDYDYIRQSDRYFVRKVNTSQSTELLDHISRDLLGHPPKSTRGNEKRESELQGSER